MIIKMLSTSIKIGNRMYSIASLCDEDFDLILMKYRIFDQEIKSFIDYDDQIIVVREKLPIDYQQELILHELLHACLNDAGIEQGKDDERFINILAPRLSSLISSGIVEAISKFR